MTAANAMTSANAAAPLLQIDALGVSIGSTQIIKNLSLEVGAGEVLGLVGASGSGKSMLALAIMRLLPASAVQTGTVRLRGESLMQKSERELQKIRGRDMGIVFQEPMTALNPLMSIGDQVAETIRLHRSISAAEAGRAAQETLDLVGLQGAAGAPHLLPYELSGGQRQRVAIAIAVAMAPPLLIADEPTTALDVNTQARVLRLLRELVRTRNMGLILVSHDLAVVAQVTDRIAVMHQGEIVESGATRQLLRHMRHPYGRALLAAAQLQPSRRATLPEAQLRRRQAAVPVLQVRDAVQEYPHRRRALWRRPVPLRAVDGVSLSVYAGETVGLVGESGSGKSSLLRIILALERPRSGEVCLLGDAFSTAKGLRLHRLRRRIQAVFQDPYGSFDPRWSVERLIAEPFFLLESPPGRALRCSKVAAMLELVGLSASDARRYPQEFSGGQRQRIAIARALVTEPSLIALDEAVSALDVLARAQILELLAGLAERLNLAYLFVSHDLSVVRSIADRVYVMQRGRIVEHGPTEAVFTSPRHAYTEALLAAAPRIG